MTAAPRRAASAHDEAIRSEGAVRPRAGSVWPLLAFTAVTIAAVTGVGLAVVASPTWSADEMRAVEAVHGAHNALFDLVALTINTVFGSAGAVLVVAVSLAWALLVTRSWRPPLRIFVVLVVPWVLAEAIKPVAQRPRPDPALLSPAVIPDPATFSYPSGHTAFAAALVCALVIVLAPAGSRGIPIAAGTVIVLITAWSRVYLGVHYPSDVAASMLVVPMTAIAVDRVVARWSWSVSPRDRGAAGAARE